MAFYCDNCDHKQNDHEWIWEKDEKGLKQVTHHGECMIDGCDCDQFEYHGVGIGVE